jgi:hypothetical protein
MEVPFARYSAVSDRYRAGSFGSTRANALLDRLRGPLRPLRGRSGPGKCHAPCWPRLGATGSGFLLNKGPGHQKLPNEQPRMLKPALNLLSWVLLWP